MFNNHTATSQHSNPLKPRNNMFTCLTCQVAFPTPDRQRTHYRSDWHKYNLKRKIAQLSSVDAEQFAQKVLAQQSKGKEEQEKQGLVYECTVCRKSYFSENAFSNHLLSKKHKDLEFNSSQEPLASPLITTSQKKDLVLFSDTEEDTDNESHSAMSAADAFAADHQTLSEDRCLFCNVMNTDFEDNLKHMELVHGFFLPDIEYLEDVLGLILYLAGKINDCICLYCNGRGKEYKTQHAVRKHMLDKGHCKMAYDESENSEDLLRFYNFGTMSEQDFEAAIADTAANEDDELVLESGQKLGNRRFMRYYKQSLRRTSLKDENDTDPLAIAAAAQEESQAVQPRNRKERRAGSRFAITDGSSSGISRADMLNRLPEIVQKQHYQHQVSQRNNLVATSRLRIQNPI